MENRVVSFHYTLTDATGETLDSSIDSEPMTFVEGKSEIIRGLETQIKPLKLGEKKKFKVAAKDAYGDYDAALITTLPKSNFPQGDTIEVGDQYRMTNPDSEPKIYTVVEIQEANVKLDGNHPLAGKDLFFDVEVTSAREASEEDMKEHDECCSDHNCHSN